MPEKTQVIKLLALIEKGIESKVPENRTSATNEDVNKNFRFSDPKGRDYLRKSRTSPLMSLLAGTGGLTKKEERPQAKPDGEPCKVSAGEVSQLIAMYGTDVVKRMRMCPTYSRKLKKALYTRDVENFEK